MAFDAQLIAHRPRETAGSLSANRFEFQLNWAICHLIKLHRTIDEYVVLIDYHEDIVVLNAETNPTSAEFFQIKSKTTGNWTTKQLIKQEKGNSGKKLSILGKLYHSYTLWPNCTAGLYFVSNAPLKAKDQKSQSTIKLATIPFSALLKSEQDEIVNSINTEHSTQDASTGLKLFTYKKCNLTPSGQAEMAIGVVANFLESIQGGQTLPAPAFYRALKDELQRRFRTEQIPISYNELREFKGLSGSHFAKMIEVAVAEPLRQDLATLIGGRLNSEDVPFAEVNRIRNEVSKIQLKLLDSSNLFITDSLSVVRGVVTQVKRHSRLWDTIEETASHPGLKTLKRTLSHDVVRAMIGICLHESNDTLPAPDPDAQEKAT